METTFTLKPPSFHTCYMLYSVTFMETGSAQAELRFWRSRSSREVGLGRWVRMGGCREGNGCCVCGQAGTLCPPRVRGTPANTDLPTTGAGMANVDTRSKQKGRVSPSLINYWKRIDRHGLGGIVAASAEENGYIAVPIHSECTVFRPISGKDADDELVELVCGGASGSDDEDRLSPSILQAPPPRRPVARALAQPHRAGSTSRGHMTTANCKRSSRMARPSEPSNELLDRGFHAINEKERQLIREGWTRVQGDPDEERWRLDHGLDAAPTGKGSAVPAAVCVPRGGASQQTAAQSRVNHIASVKSKTVDTGTHEPAWLISMSAPCGQMYGRLAATAIKRCTSLLLTLYCTTPFTL